VNKKELTFFHSLLQKRRTREAASPGPNGDAIASLPNLNSLYECCQFAGARDFLNTEGSEY